MLEHAVPIGEANRFAGYVGSAVDINARYRETERQTLLAELAVALDDETGVVPRMEQLTRLLAERRIADQCTVIQVGPRGELHRVADAAADTTGEFVGEADPDPEQLTARGPGGVSSVIGAPLVARGQLLGILLAGRQAESAHYDAADLALLEEIAQRAGIALDNTLLLAEEQATAASWRCCSRPPRRCRPQPPQRRWRRAR